MLKVYPLWIDIELNCDYNLPVRDVKYRKPNRHDAGDYSNLQQI